MDKCQNKYGLFNRVITYVRLYYRVALTPVLESAGKRATTGRFALLVTTGGLCAIALTRGRRLSRTVLAVLFPALALAWMRSRVNGAIRSVRREASASLVEDNLNQAYRNPLWAVDHPDAVKLPTLSSDEPYLRLDGAPQRNESADAGFVTVTNRERADAWLVPTAKYHVTEFGPVLSALEDRGVRAKVALHPNATAGLLDEVARLGLPFLELDTSVGAMLPGAVVVMNDWGAERSWLEDVRAKGVRVIAKVEGAQDFSNKDTLRFKLPYSFADLVLTQGPYDSAHVYSENICEVGSVRVESIRRLIDAALVETPVRDAVINFNFAYGAFPWASREWLRDAVDVSQRVSGEAHVSVHPAVATLGVAQQVLSTWPLALDLETSRVLISRCSTAMFDMLALNRPVVYFNPHAERVWEAMRWSEPVWVARNTAELEQGLRSAVAHANSGESDSAFEFLRNHFIAVDESLSAVDRTAHAILEGLC